MNGSKCYVFELTLKLKRIDIVCITNGLSKMSLRRYQVQLFVMFTFASAAALPLPGRPGQSTRRVADLVSLRDDPRLAAEDLARPQRVPPLRPALPIHTVVHTSCKTKFFLDYLSTYSAICFP